MNTFSKISILFGCLLLIVACSAKEKSNNQKENEVTKANIDASVKAGLDTAYFAAGCFWCVEAVYERTKGVVDVVSGYSGGTSDNPTYEKVGAGLTNYAESVRVAYNPDEVSYETLVKIFFGTQNPTQVNGQGPDHGKQYRSAIWYRTDREKEIATKIKNELDASGKYNKPIAAEITKFISFYEAEDYHQNYYELHPNQPYVANVSRERVEMFYDKFKDLVKDKYKK